MDFGVIFREGHRYRRYSLFTVFSVLFILCGISPGLAAGAGGLGRLCAKVSMVDRLGGYHSAAAFYWNIRLRQHSEQSRKSQNGSLQLFRRWRPES